VPASSAGLNLFSMGELLFVAGVGQDSFAGNPDYGMVLQSNGSFVTNHHVINATPNDATITGTFNVSQLTTPLSLKTGQGITFTCNYTNATDATIGFGLTATTEMCAAMNQYAYPVGMTHQVPPELGTTILSNGTPATVGNTANSTIPLF
jgi:hypothetical protein